MQDRENIMNQIESIKTELEKLQNQLGEERVYGKEDYGLVTTVANGRGKIIDFKFNEGVVDRDFKKAIIKSINDALEKAEKIEKEQKQKIIGDIPLPDIPGLF